MAQLHPVAQFFGHTEDVAHGENLHLIKILVYSGLQKCLELVHAIFDLVSRFCFDFCDGPLVLFWGDILAL